VLEIIRYDNDHWARCCDRHVNDTVDLEQKTNYGASKQLYDACIDELPHMRRVERLNKVVCHTNVDYEQRASQFENAGLFILAIQEDS
jgi:hypothetical protein